MKNFVVIHAIDADTAICCAK